jgi:hypothetical protein
MLYGKQDESLKTTPSNDYSNHRKTVKDRNLNISCNGQILPNMDLRRPKGVNIKSKATFPDLRNYLEITKTIACRTEKTGEY